MASSWTRRAEPVPVAVLREEAGTAIAARLGALQKMAADARTAMAALNRSAASAGERSSPMAAMKATKAKKTAIPMKAMKTKNLPGRKTAWAEMIAELAMKHGMSTTQVAKIFHPKHYFDVDNRHGRQRRVAAAAGARAETAKAFAVTSSAASARAPPDPAVSRVGSQPWGADKWTCPYCGSEVRRTNKSRHLKLCKKAPTAPQKNRSTNKRCLKKPSRAARCG